MRAPGRSGVPASFGRARDEEPAEDFTIRGGEAIHLVLHVDVTPDPESLAKLRETIRETTRVAVVEGYASAVADMDAAALAELAERAAEPGGGDGGAPPGDATSS